MGTETKKEYTNLPEGNYRFRVRAKNIYGTRGVKLITACASSRHGIAPGGLMACGLLEVLLHWSGSFICTP